MSGLAVAAGGDEVSAEGAALVGGEACVGVAGAVAGGVAGSVAALAAGATGAAGAGLGAGGGKRGNCTQSLLPAVAAAVGEGRVADRLSVLELFEVVAPVLGVAGAGSGAVIGAGAVTGAGTALRGSAGKRIQSALGSTTPEASRLAPKSPADCA